MRELVWMAEARSRAEWDRTAALMALTANIHRDPKKTRRYKPKDFNPYCEIHDRIVPPSKDAMQILKQVFVDSRRTTK